MRRVQGPALHMVLRGIFVNGNALLIGNSDGIGLAMTGQLLDRGFTVTGVSKSPSPVVHDAYRHVVLDVTSGTYPRDLDAAIPAGTLRLCVYCAGIGDKFALDALPRDVATLDVNLMGMVKTIERVLPRMISDGNGGVLAGLWRLWELLPAGLATLCAVESVGMT